MLFISCDFGSFEGPNYTAIFALEKLYLFIGSTRETKSSQLPLPLVESRPKVACALRAGKLPVRIWGVTVSGEFV